MLLGMNVWSPPSLNTVFSQMTEDWRLSLWAQVLRGLGSAGGAHEPEQS